MNPRDETDVIDLGRATLETRGGPLGMDDTQVGRYPWPGLNDDD